MKDYLILQLKNNKECILIDIIECYNKKYFLVVDNFKKLFNLKETFEIYIYNESKNTLEKITNNNERNLVFIIFEKKLENEKIISNILNKMYGMKIIDIKNNIYFLEDRHGIIKSKCINFLVKDIPKIGDYIFMSEKIINETNIFEYGKIYNFSMLKEDELIKIKTNKNEYFLQRYYG